MKKVWNPPRGQRAVARLATRYDRQQFEERFGVLSLPDFGMAGRGLCLYCSSEDRSLDVILGL
jgi:hypothetical protein